MLLPTIKHHIMLTTKRGHKDIKYYQKMGLQRKTQGILKYKNLCH